MRQEIHPEVKEFQRFINKHPKLIEQIRRSGKAWQYYYERWVLNGENDPIWKDFIKNSDQEKTANHPSKLFDQLLELSQKIDVEKIQEQVKKIDDTIDTVQGLLNQLHDKKNEAGNNLSPNPFSGFRD